MSATAALSIDPKRYLARVQDCNIVFTPIKNTPTVRNFFLIETKEILRYSNEEQKFMPTCTTGILYIKHNDQTQKLRGFKARTQEELLAKISSFMFSNYVKCK